MRMSTTKPIALLLAIAALLLVAGCGGDDGDDYASDVSDIMAPLGQSLQEYGADASAATGPDDVTGALDDSEAAVSDAIEDLQGLDPPDDFSSLNDDLISTLESYRTTLTDTNEALQGANSQQELASVLGEFSTDSQDFATQLQDLQGEFEDKGIEFEGES